MNLLKFAVAALLLLSTEAGAAPNRACDYTVGSTTTASGFANCTEEFGETYKRGFVFTSGVSGTDSILAVSTPAVTTLSEGLTAVVTPLNTITGPATFRLDATTAAPILKQDGVSTLAAGDIVAGTRYVFSYRVSSAAWILMGSTGSGAAAINVPYVTIGNTALLPSERAITPDGTTITGTDGGANGAFGLAVTTNGIGDTQLRQGTATSVIGRSVNSLGNVADIQAAADNRILARASGALSFRQIVNADVTTNTLTYSALQQASTVTLLGNPTGGTANVQEITLGPNLGFVGSTIDVVGAATISTGTGISAAGATQGTATVLTATSPIQSWVVSTVAAGTGVRLPSASITVRYAVINLGANPLRVYGGGTNTIDGVATGTGILIPVDGAAWFIPTATTAWRTVRQPILSGDVATSATDPLTTTIQPGSVALTTDTTGNYVTDVAEGTGIAITGTLGEGWTPTASWNYANTLAGNPVLTAGQCTASSEGAAGGGFICEGSVADAFEGAMRFPNVTGADATHTLLTDLTFDTSTEVAGIVGDETGTSLLVFNTNPVLVTPNLGTPSAVTLTNATGLPTTALTGALQAAQFPALTGDVTTVAGNLSTTIAANAVALTTDTTGNYVADVADGTGIDGTASGEGTTYTPTLDLTEVNSATWGAGAFTGFTFNAGAVDISMALTSGELQFNAGGTSPIIGIDDGGEWRFYEEDAGGSNYSRFIGPATLAANFDCQIQADGRIPDSCVGDGSDAGAGGGSGDVIGPASSVDNAIVRMDGTTGKIVQESPVIIEDTGEVNLPLVTTPATPATDTLNVYARKKAGRMMIGANGPSGLDHLVQPHIANNKVGWWTPPGNATTVPGVVGFAAPTALGTVTTRNVASTNMITRTRRLGWVSNATAASFAGHYNGAAATQFTIGDGAGLGGFYYSTRFTISDAAAVSGARMFVGLRNSSGVPGNNEPNTLTNVVGVCDPSASANLHICYGGSAAQTAIDLGANFPDTHGSANLYELTLYAPPLVQEIYYEVVRLNTGDKATGTLSGTVGTVIPAATTFLGHTAWRTNNATLLAVGLDVVSIYIETDN